MISKRLFLILATLSIYVVTFAQPGARGLARPGNLGAPKSQEKAEPNKNDTVRPGSAWTLTFPLGDHVESSIDTVTYNFQRTFIPSMESDAYAATGNIGGEGINLIYFDRPRRSTFFFQDALDVYLPLFRKQKFYNIYVPTTIVTYGFGGTNQTQRDRLSVDFAGNVNRRIGIGASCDFIYSFGSMANQAAKDFSFGLSTYYLGDRYELQAFYNHYNFINKENGGITDDLYITDPAQLQGGINQIEYTSIPTRLSNARTKINGDELFMTHAFKIGYWKSVEVNDTLTREVYVPVTKFIYSFDMQHHNHTFRNTNTSQAEEFWKNFYLNPNQTLESSYLTEITNSIGVEMIEGFNKWAKFGLSAYISYQTQSYKQPTYYLWPELSESEIAKLTPLPENFYVAPKSMRNLLWVGGRINKDKGSILKYAASARFGLVGDVIGDLEIDGKINTRFRLFGDSVNITAKGEFRNIAQPYLIQNYISNHFAWNNNFGKTRTYKVEGELMMPWLRTTLSAGVENIQNLVYFDSACLPSQFGGNVQVMTVKLDQPLKLGILNWNNTIYYQRSTKQSVLPLPELSIYSNLFLKFIAFKVLKVQIGMDCDFYTKYNSLAYQPATMTFHLQGDDPVKIGNYPFCNLYFNARLYKTRFYVLWSHVNQGLFSKESFSMPHYPFNPRRFEFGVSVDFTN